jgi:superfamily II DNA helicase RecQ
MDLSKTHRDQYQGISDVQDSLFPRQTRFLEKTMAKHTHVMSFGWNIHDIRNSRVVWNNRGKTMFSQTALEKSIRKNRRVLKNYLELIYRILEMTYIKEYVDGDTAIIYAHTIKMCQQIRDYVAERLPHLDVRTAIGGDPYENRHEGTIVVTTEGSLGTGTDKKNLRTVVYTVNRSSPVAVDQTAGRLRDLRNRDTKFAYMFCTQIPKTVQYHKEKAQVLLQRAKSIRHFTVNESL